MKEIYTQMAHYEFQKIHPFGLTDQRFGGKKNNFNGNDLTHHKKIVRNKKRDNLEGGLGNYLTTANIDNEREREKLRANLLKDNYTIKYMKNKIAKERANKFVKFDTKRVIYPEKNTEINKVQKIRTYRSQEKNYKKHTEGRISTLINKTPLQYDNKGKKIVNNSIDYGKRKDTALFSEEFLNDKKYNRLFGVTRKLIIPKVNRESLPSDYFYTAGRKRFMYIAK